MPVTYDLGQEPGATHIVARILEASLNGTAFTLYGSDYDTPDGSCIRDYVHVSDIANAHVLAIDKMISGELNGYNIFNLGSENGVSVLELIKTFEEVNNLKVNYKIGNRREGDVVEIYSDSSKAKSIGWSPKRKIEDMVCS